ncbi:MAG: hypothetical protein JSW14_01990 [Candidatus Bathyarchaeum sp.]|nr:MAG: hypothetical protein JSW14_01990 [Candidatus Bathyarchaeum sp.]
MALQEQARSRQSLAKKRLKAETETEKPQRPLPMWCRGIMSGCINCGGCV